MAFKSRIHGNILRVRLPPNRILGRNLVRLRSQANLTQERLAEKADISRGFLQEIEKGGKNPSINVVARLKQALRCSWDELFRGLD
jgi:transcriptional regulator with XRE-family HTH domain